MRGHMTETLYDRIERIKTQAWIGDPAARMGTLHSIIDELTERLERAHQIFQDLDEELAGPFETLLPHVQTGLDLTDIVQDYPMEIAP
jgi:hypothetical protein